MTFFIIKIISSPIKHIIRNQIKIIIRHPIFIRHISQIIMCLLVIFYILWYRSRVNGNRCKYYINIILFTEVNNFFNIFTLIFVNFIFFPFKTTCRWLLTIFWPIYKTISHICIILIHADNFRRIILICIWLL